MTPAFHPLKHLHRLYQAQRLRRGCGVDLPGWALAEVSFSPSQAAWLLRTLCAWHGLSTRGTAPQGCNAVPLADLRAALADAGLGLRACRLSDPRALVPGDVAILTGPASRRLFGDAACGGGGLALVVAAGSQTLRLSPAMAADPKSCPSAELQGALVGWVLRSQPGAAPAAGRAWAGGLVAAG